MKLQGIHFSLSPPPLYRFFQPPPRLFFVFVREIVRETDILEVFGVLLIKDVWYPGVWDQAGLQVVCLQQFQLCDLNVFPVKAVEQEMVKLAAESFQHRVDGFQSMRFGVMTKVSNTGSCDIEKDVRYGKS